MSNRTSEGPCGKSVSRSNYLTNAQRDVTLKNGLPRAMPAQLQL